MGGWSAVPAPLLFFVVAFWMWHRDRNGLALICAGLGLLVTIPWLLSLLEP